MKPQQSADTISLDDWRREAMIQTLSDKIQKEPDRAKAQVIWDELKLLINGRSEAQVERMEREKGLR